MATNQMALDRVFDPEPVRWGLRADPAVWRAMRERTHQTLLPDTVDAAIAAVRATFRDVVGVGLNDAALPDRVVLSHLDTGGMSGGAVDLVTWRDELLPLLEARLVALYAS
jgi:ABC-type uncharacterized transport system YnjBCD ATPase subunit